MSIYTYQKFQSGLDLWRGPSAPPPLEPLPCRCTLRHGDYVQCWAFGRKIQPPVNQWRIQGGGGDAPPRWRPGSWSFSSFNVSYKVVNLSFIISGRRKWPHLAITSILWKRPSNGEQITGNSSSFRPSKLCLKCTKIRLAAGLCPEL